MTEFGGNVAVADVNNWQQQVCMRKSKYQIKKCCTAHKQYY